MHELAQLIREFPYGAFFLLISLIWAGEEAIKAIAQRNRPIVKCNCENCEDDEDEEEE